MGDQVIGQLNVGQCEWTFGARAIMRSIVRMVMRVNAGENVPKRKRTQFLRYVFSKRRLQIKTQRSSNIEMTTLSRFILIKNMVNLSTIHYS